MNEPTDEFGEFEAELSSLRPAAIPPALAERIAQQLDRPDSFSLADRCLATFMGAGALAASVIVVLTAWQVIENQRTGPSALPPPAIVAQQQPPPSSIGALQQALARSNGPTLELLR